MNCYMLLVNANSSFLRSGVNSRWIGASTLNWGDFITNKPYETVFYGNIRTILFENVWKTIMRGGFYNGGDTDTVLRN